MNQKLIEIYQDTKRICSSISPPRSEIIGWSSLKEDNGDDDSAGNVIVEPMDTVSAIIKYSKRGKTAVLNMASVKRKGGGVENGAVAQEECLFRCSNLYNIPDEFYPIGEDELIYTHGATFVKDFMYNPINHVVVDVITIPAINLNNRGLTPTGLNKTKSSYKLTHEEEISYLDKMHLMIGSAIYNECNNIILGAWGCGVFKNNPKIISELFRETLESLRYRFDNVIFAIINDRNSTDNNYEIFKQTFK